MFTKATSLILAAVMMAGIAAGCGGENQAVSASNQDSQTQNPGSVEPETDSLPLNAGNTESVQTWSAEEPDEIKWVFWAMNSTPDQEAVAEVEDALNAITIPRIGVKVDMEITDVGTYMSQMSMRIVSGESIDLYTTFIMGSSSYQTMLDNGQLMDITEMLPQNAPETAQLLPEEFLAGASRSGRLYGIPLYTNLVTDNYWVCDKEVFDAMGFDPSELTDLDSIHEALVQIKEAYSEMLPLGGNSFVFPGGQNYEMLTGQHVEYFGPAYVRYEEEGQEYTVTDRFESENFKYLADTLRQWNEEGLVDRDMAMNSATMWYQNPRIVSSFESQNYVEMRTLEQSAGREFEFVKLSSNNVSSTSLGGMTLAVPVTAKEPEAALRFANLLYTDKEVKNLVCFGIEGKHWEFKDNGTIGFPEGVNETNSGYYLGSERIFGNAFLNYPWENMDPEAMAQEETIMENAVYSSLVGFSFDTTPVSNETASLNTVIDEYFNTLMGGGGDEQTYDDFIKKLKASGLDTYLAEVQRQLDEWRASVE